MLGPIDSEEARVASELALRGVRAVALTWVDNAGITRVKAVPVAKLVDAVRRGVGMSPVFDVFVVDDSITTSEHIGGPVGDLRLFPDLDRLCVLHAMPGWAWAPVDRRTQEGGPWVACHRGFAARAAAAAAERGLELQMAFELEWFVGFDDGDGLTPACDGPAYGMTRMVELSGYLRDLLAALEEQEVPVDQVHPEYAAGQLELSVGATDPVAAADRLVLVKQTVRAVSQSHGLRASFAPVVVAGRVGNGGHLHFSCWSEGRNLFGGGDRQHGLTADGESILAGVLARLPALCAVGAPSVASYLRLVPQRWAGAYQCWGVENREAGLRFVRGGPGEAGAAAANAEIKCFDLSSNPYLVAGAVTAVAAASIDAKLDLPPEVTVDPSGLDDEDQPPLLPRTLALAAGHLASDEVLRAAMGEPLMEAYLAVRQAEIQLLADRPDEEVVAAIRWRH